MLYVKTDISFERMKTSLSYIRPHMNVTHIVTDYTLQKLGFTENPPCIFSMDISWEAFDDMMDDIMMLEVWAYYSGEENRQSDAFKAYTAHGWLWDVLFNARKNNEITEDLGALFS